MVRNAALLRRRHLVGPDIEPAIHGGRIAIDDLAAESLGDRQRQGTLARRGRAKDRNEALHCVSRHNTNTTSSEATISRPSCCERVGTY